MIYVEPTGSKVIEYMLHLFTFNYYTKKIGAQVSTLLIYCKTFLLKEEINCKRGVSSKIWDPIQ